MRIKSDLPPDAYVFSSAADLDLYVFGPPGSGPVSQVRIIGSVSGSLYHQAK
jgi:hypothetical protein